MTGMEIAAVIAMLAGAGMQYKATTDAAARQQRETLAALARQRDLQMQAEQKAMDTAEQFAPEERKQEQAQIEQQLTTDYLQPTQTAQEIHNTQSTTQGDVSNDYLAAKAASNANQMKMASSLARLLGKTTAASRLRTNEAIRVSDAAAGIDRLANFAQGTGTADRVAIGAAGRPNAGLILGGQVLGALGSAGLMAGAGQASAAGSSLAEATPAYAGGWDGGMSTINGAFGTTKSVPLDLGTAAAGAGSGVWAGPAVRGAFAGVGSLRR
ncbi:hypothetical protein [Cupriavidus sp. IK-TO18]|uniref:hypothetical protein n=1 Tax=Cupriavidus sp. IK-TO18 TaxID=2782182 RepID=UPI00189BE252|nr:hypothetical protein [Cupriavidus sp. IK-TO18]MBF6990936.1 hypothetical protein [Cupriavidus sp. IK-TO18]